MSTFHETPLAPLSAVLIASTLDCLPLLPADQQRDPRIFAKIALALGAEAHEAAGVHLRLHATEVLFADPRWQPWKAYFRSADRPARIAFDALVILLIATMPMTKTAGFIADDFFELLIARAGSQTRHRLARAPNGGSDLTKKTAPGLSLRRPRAPRFG